MRARPTLLLMALGCRAVPLAMMGALLLGAGAAALAAQGRPPDDRGFAYLAVICVLAALSLVRALAARLPPPGAEGVVIDGERTPELRALADGMDELRLTLRTSLVVAREGERRTMTLGLPFVAALDGSSLRASIALAIAEQQVADTRFERFAMRAWRRLRYASERALLPLRPPLRGYLRRYETALGPEVDAAREVAFTRAADQVGADALERALAECRVVDLGWDLFWREQAGPALDGGLRPPLASGFRTWIHEARLEAETEPWPAGGDAGLVAEAALVERALLAHVASDLHVADLVPSTWSDVAVDVDVDDEDSQEPSALRAHGLPFTTRLAVPLRTRGAVGAVLALIVLTLGPMTAIFVNVALAPLEQGGHWLGWILAALTAGAMVILAGRQLIRVWPPGRVTSDGYMLVVEHPRMLRRPYTVALEQVRAIALDDDADLRFAVYDDSPWSVPVEGGAEPLAYLWGGGGSPVPLIDLTPDAPNVAVVLDEALVGPDLRRTPLHGSYVPPRIRGFLLRVDSPERFLDSGAVRDLRLEDLRALDVPVR